MKFNVNHPRLDAAENAYFANELEHIIPEPFDVKRAPLKALQFIPVDPEADPADETVTYQMFEHTGVAKLIRAYSDGLPRADVKGRQYHSPIKSVGSSFGYNIQEIRAGAKTGRPIDRSKGTAAERAVAAEIDRIAAFGDEEAGLLGLLNQPNALDFTVPAGKGQSADTTWATKTPQEILADMYGIESYAYSMTNEVEKPDTLLLPPDQFQIVATTQATANSDLTILEVFLRNAQHVKAVDQWHRLKGIGEDGSDRMVAYRRALDAVRLILPIDFEMLPPEARGLEFVVPVHARCGGVVSPFPLSICYGDGI